MDMNKKELVAVQVVENQAADAITELNELQLLIVGGGCGDITLGR
jgi:hypothetical protein